MSVDMDKVLDVYRQERALTKKLNDAETIDERLEIHTEIQKLIYYNLNTEEALRLHFMIRDNNRQKQ